MEQAGARDFRAAGAPSGRAWRSRGSHGKAAGRRWFGRSRDEDASAGASGRRVTGSDDGLTGHARLLAAPAYSRLLRSESWLRRMIPLLVAALLIGIAIVRTTLLTTSAEELDSTTRNQLQLVAAVTSERLLDLPGLEDVVTDRALARGLLEQATPGFMEPAGRYHVLATGGGQLLAVWPEDRQTTTAGRFTPRGISDLITALTGERTTRTAQFPDGTDVLAIARTVTTLPDGTTLKLLVFQDEATLYAAWRRNLASEATILAALAVVMFFILFAYFRQNQRTLEADYLYLDTQDRNDTALLRGRCGLWNWDLARGRVFWSPSMYALLGHRPGDGKLGRESCDDGVLGLGEIAELVHPDDLNLMNVGNDALTDPNGVVDHRFRMRCADGSWTALRLRAELVSQNGLNPHLIGIAVDISVQEALERKSERAEANLLDAVDSISEAFVIWDRHKRLVLCNTKFRQFHKLPEGIAKPGSRYDDVIAAAQGQVSSREVESREASDEDERTLEIQLEDDRWLQVAERRTRDGNLVSVQTDISPIKRNEEMLLHSDRKLRATIDDLEAAKLESEIRAQENYQLASEHHEAQMRAEAGNRAKSQFLQNMSHELRTPLNAILGFSDVIKGGFLGPNGMDKYQEYAGDIHASGTFLLGVINDVLDMSKIEAGRMNLEPAPMDLREIVDETLRMIAVQARDKGVELRCTVPDIVKIEADRRSVKQVLVNLVSNAVKFTDRGGTVDVLVRRHGGTVRIAIADSGCGIPHEALKKLGQPFEQVKTQMTRDHDGSGLGLAIARSLAQMHGGRLDIRSIVGRGTFVLVRLPEVATRGSEAGDGERSAEEPAGIENRGSKATLGPVRPHLRAA